MWEMGSSCLGVIKCKSECLKTFHITKECKGLFLGGEREGNFNLSVKQS